jgi:hypothetical protein
VLLVQDTFLLMVPLLRGLRNLRQGRLRDKLPNHPQDRPRDKLPNHPQGRLRDKLRHPPPNRTEALPTSPDIRKLPTFIQTTNGSDMTPVALIPPTISIAPGNTDALRVVLDEAMCFTWGEAARSGSDLTAFSSALPHMTSVT